MYENICAQRGAVVPRWVGEGVSTLPENFQTKENFEKIFCKFIP